MYDAASLLFLEDIGSSTEPVVSGNAVCLDVDTGAWRIVVANDSGGAAALSFTI